MMVFGDMLVFGLFFAAYLYYRGQEIALFDRSQKHLSTAIGVVNTLLLLTSSWMVVRGVNEVERHSHRRGSALLFAAALCGIGFVILKGIEYCQKLADGISLVTNHFYMYYFMFTGIHLVHVILGVGVLLMLSREAATAGTTNLRALENGAIFWHMVDLLWIMLFPLLYLVH